MKVNSDKNLIIFDLDGTLTESKSDLNQEMAVLLKQLLAVKKVAIIGGQKYERFQEQFLSKLNASPDLLRNLFLFPMNASAFYRFEDGPLGSVEARPQWEKIYEESLSAEEKQKIFDAFEKTFKELNYTHPEKVYGEVIEDRGAQITFSALGQRAPLDLKKKWKEEQEAAKMKIIELLRKILPEFTVMAAGLTSIDVTRKGIDKEYGINQIQKHLGVPIEEMLFVGDALFPGGNDFAAVNTGIECIRVNGPEEAAKIIKDLLYK